MGPYLPVKIVHIPVILCGVVKGGDPLIKGDWVVMCK